MTTQEETEALEAARRIVKEGRYPTRVELLLARALLSSSASLREMREALEASMKALDILMPGVGRVTSSMEEVSAINVAYYLGTRALAALSGIEPDNQARSASHRSAPASTLSKDTTK